MIDTQAIRNKILDLAIRGKLVPQDPNDEPASVLLERIRAERERLIAEGKIKKGKTPSRIFRGADNTHYEIDENNASVSIEDEIPFVIPKSWAWCRISSLFSINPRNQLPDDTVVGFMSMSLLEGGLNNHHTYEEKRWGDVKKGFTHFRNNDVVIAKITPCFQNRKSAVIKYLPNEYGAGTTELHVLRDNTRILHVPYFLLCCKTNNFINGGIASFTGTAGQQRIGKDYISNYLIPLPPVYEQRRIVAKIDQVFSVLTEIDKFQTQYADNLTVLKKSILQEAVMGKLVPQDPNDEPASVLIERIRAEKERLIAEGKIKRDENESRIYKRGNSYYEKLEEKERCIDKELPFNIPENWEWVRLGNIGNWQSGSTPPRNNSEYYGGNIPWLKTGDLNDGYINFTSETITKKALEERKLHLNPVGSILIAMYGATIGKLGILNISSATNQACCACLPILISNRYLFYFLMSQKDHFTNKAVGGAQPNISKEKIVATLFPIPPLAEQKRIVIRIESSLKIAEKM